MSKRSRGRLDEQESPAKPNPARDGHHGALHCALSNPAATLNAMQTDGNHPDLIATHDRSPHEATPDVNSHRESATQSRDSTSSDSTEFLAWKAAGRPDCPRCLKSHCGECRLSKMESDFLERDPEGYARYRKRMKKPKSRCYQHVANMKSESHRHPLQQDETTAAQNVSNPEGPLQHDEAPATHNMSNLERMASSPWVLEKAAAIISEASLRELEDIQRYLETEPHMAVVARMTADALQQMRVTGASIAESPQSDGLRETDAPQAADGTTVEDTSHNNSPSVNFRTGAELAYHRSLEQGGPSAKAEGKQPKK